MTALTRRKLLLATAAGAAALPFSAPVFAQAKPRELRLGLITPAGHSWNNTAVAFGKKLEQATDGRLKLTVFHSGQLGNESVMLQQMQSGALDMGWLQAAELGSRVPNIAAINAPYLVRSTASAAKLVRHPEALKLFDALPRETGTIGLGWGITGVRAVFCNRDIDSLDGLKGLKIRINPTPAFRDFYQLLGISPTPIPTPQVFDAMSNGQVDGLEADIEFSWNQRFDRVSKVILAMNAVFMPFGALVSGRVWQTFSQDDRDLITRLVKESLDEQIDSLASAEPALIEKFRAERPIHEVGVAQTEPIIVAYDKIWQPKAPSLAALRKVGATL